jgi:uncharacterized protein (UPF0335 family)
MTERTHNASAARLRAFVSRIERLDEEIDERNGDKSEVYKEAKGEGFDLPALREIIAKRRKMAKDPAKYAEHRDIVEMYEAELGGDAPASRAHAREEAKPKQRAPRSAYQAHRMASPRELLDAYHAGNPISQDAKFQGASIYFAASLDAGRLKIGLSNNTAERIATLARECRGLEMLGTTPGNRQEELRTLERFAEWRIEGEWFRWCAETEALVTSILKPETFDKDTGEVLGDAPAPAGETSETGEVRAVDGAANAETSSSEALCEHGAGAPMHPQDPAPQPIGQTAIDHLARVVATTEVLVNGRQALRTLPPRVPEPAPEMPDLPAFLDRRNEQAEQEAAE